MNPGSPLTFWIFFCSGFLPTSLNISPHFLIWFFFIYASLKCWVFSVLASACFVLTFRALHLFILSSRSSSTPTAMILSRCPQSLASHTRRPSCRSATWALMLEGLGTRQEVWLIQISAAPTRCCLKTRWANRGQRVKQGYFGSKKNSRAPYIYFPNILHLSFSFI